MTRLKVERQVVLVQRGKKVHYSHAMVAVQNRGRQQENKSCCSSAGPPFQGPGDKGLQIAGGVERKQCAEVTGMPRDSFVELVYNTCWALRQQVYKDQPRSYRLADQVGHNAKRIATWKSRAETRSLVVL